MDSFEYFPIGFLIALLLGLLFHALPIIINKATYWQCKKKGGHFYNLNKEKKYVCKNCGHEAKDIK